jgi:hypothetical protein
LGFEGLIIPSANTTLDESNQKFMGNKSNLTTNPSSLCMSLPILGKASAAAVAFTKAKRVRRATTS